MDDISLVKSVLDLTSLNILDSLYNVHCNCTSLWIWHKSLRTKYTSETSNNAHHVRCSDNYIEIKPSFILDLWNELIATSVISACSKCLINIVTLSENKNLYSLTCSVRKNNGTTYLLICMTSINTKSDVCFDCLIELCIC